MSNRTNQSIREILKQIPSVDKLILYCYKKHNIKFPHFLLKTIVSEQVTIIRNQIKNNNVRNIKGTLYNRLEESILLNNTNKLNKIINGTGIVLHTGLGRAPISKKILRETVDNIYPYSNLEFDIRKNSRGERNNHISYLINSITSS